jgi:hypothetical protein
MDKETIQQEHQEEKECKHRVKSHYDSRISDLKELWKAHCSGENDGYAEDIGRLDEYGLSFDYVAPGTFSDQKVGYFRYQISWGGPSDEFRFYVNSNFSVTRIEYWFLDWFDGAKIRVTGKRFELMLAIFDDFRDSGTVTKAYRDTMFDS